MRIKHVGGYPKKPFKATAAKAWSEFFKIASDRVDVAYWSVYPWGGFVRLYARISSVHEFDFGFEELEPVHISVPGVVKLFHTEPDDDAVCRSFQEWAEKGILDAFHSARITKKYQRFNPDGSAFAIVTSETDCGLADCDEVSLLWTSRPRFTVARIKSRYKAAEAAARKARKGWKVVKKRRVKAVKKKR